ncbi:MAG: peptide chain release factor 2 [Eubacteriales bacterium]|nr:peptide chain release factor 2 [Candidatus Hippenecus merdae]MCQ2415134.1 peptide chain release factor 2 [Lachnospiraceae bacterium]MDO4810099.1 peptide chain release factor 2 [Eubacteriales bacterium]
MVELDNYKSELNSLREPLKELGASLDLENKKQKIAEMERGMEEPGFWDDPEKSTRTVKELKNMKDAVAKYAALNAKVEDIETLIEMGVEENGDDEITAEAGEELKELKADLENMRTSLLLSGEYDANNAIVALSAGTGGVEAMDFNGMLYRMYSRWCERHGMKMSLMDYQEGDEAGIKGVTFLVEGENAYGLLKSEMGVHRLVRISPFNAQGKRQTSFASVDVMPELDETIHIDIDPSDLKVDYYRSSGAGGQHINKTSSAVRITHIPTGIVCACQEERSQFQNKDKAMAMLRSKLYTLMQQAHAEKLSDIRGDVMQIAWGSQIRNYVLQPYTMVKDVRTGEETGNAQAVLDGEIDNFISAYLKWVQLGKPDRKVQMND